MGRWGLKGGERRGTFTLRTDSQEQSEHETGYKQIECKIVIIIPKKERKIRNQVIQKQKKEKKIPKEM